MEVRAISLVLLAVFAFFLLGSTWDECAADEREGCPPACHASCPDGCAATPLPLPTLMASRPAPQVSPPLSRGLDLPPSYLTQPETPPPRA